MDKMKNKVKNSLAGVLSVSCILFIGIVYYNGWKEYNSLKKNAEYTKAIVLKIESGPKSKYYVYFEYSINGQLFQNNILYQRRKPTFSSRPIIIGDTCTIAYDRKNPAISTGSGDFNIVAVT